MDSIQTQSSMPMNELYAMKKATQVQEQQMSKMIESAVEQSQNQPQNQMVSALTGIGQTLDIKA